MYSVADLQYFASKSSFEPLSHIDLFEDPNEIVIMHSNLSHVSAAYVLPLMLVACKRSSEELIFQDRVTVNGSVCKTPQTKVDPARDVIYVNKNHLRKKLPSKVYLALNKPKECVYPSGQRRSLDFYFLCLLVELIQDKRHPGEPKPYLFTVGRLDVATTRASSYALGSFSVVSKFFKKLKSEPPTKEMELQLMREIAVKVFLNVVCIMKKANETLLPGVYKEFGKDLLTDPTELMLLLLVFLFGLLSLFQLSSLRTSPMTIA
ncbi:hypothetical protein CQW23_31910 [Capsicum baccatum]|uniref:RNA-binding S4 domain-containing protein n=1 Tax=Capsicum baccatum TaxID=33114 RepID=A0A2G2V672_CAPBA|nr:hypothetical protein CQW23_31910 [Capsicum baccatum]